MIKAWYERWILNPKAIDIASSIRNEPQEWWSNNYTLNRGDIKVWIANGVWFCEIYRPYEEKLGLIGRSLVWRAVKFRSKYIEKKERERERQRKLREQNAEAIRAWSANDHQTS